MSGATFARASAPLVTLDPPNVLRPPTADGLRRTRVAITGPGRDVLAGRSDWIAPGGGSTDGWGAFT